MARGVGHDQVKEMIRQQRILIEQNYEAITKLEQIDEGLSTVIDRLDNILEGSMEARDARMAQAKALVESLDS